MLDCGVDMKRYNHILKKYNIVGILVTHKHMDHCKGVKNGRCLIGASVCSNRETLDFIGGGVMKYLKYEMEEMKVYEIGEDWTVIPVRVIHDVDNFGHVIKDRVTCLNIAYFTDLGYSDNLKIDNINVWMIECNHIREEVEKKYHEALIHGSEKKHYYSRVLGDKGHLSLEDSCQLIRNNYCLGLKCVVLCHISDSEDDYKRFEVIYRETLKNLEMPQNGFSVHAVNNHIRKMEEYDIVKRNKWEDLEL